MSTLVESARVPSTFPGICTASIAEHLAGVVMDALAIANLVPTLRRDEVALCISLSKY
jgi:alkyl hydroperoxide reductase subunit AhpF